MHERQPLSGSNKLDGRIAESLRFEFPDLERQVLNENRTEP